MWTSTEYLPTVALIAQDQGAPDLGGGGAQPGAGNGGAGGAGNGGGGAGGSPDFILIMFAVVIFIIIWSIFGQRKEKKKREAMLSAMRKHDRVQTVGGVIGSIVELKPDTVILKVDESSNTRMTFARSAIQQVLKEGTEKKSEEPKDTQ